MVQFDIAAHRLGRMDVKARLEDNSYACKFEMGAGYSNEYQSKPKGI